MAKHNIGIKNGMWRGGRTMASNGYVLIRVGTEHHLADCRGYAYEHRLVAEELLGRRLEPGEQVHHKDGDKTNNDPNNLEVAASAAHHQVHHRTIGRSLRLPGEENPEIRCACGCGVRFQKYDAQGRPRRYVSGHNPNQASAAAMLLSAIRGKPKRATELCVELNKSIGSIKALLSHLKRAGAVDHTWEAIDG